jgi:hypothetical protein
MKKMRSIIAALLVAVFVLGGLGASVAGQRHSDEYLKLRKKMDHRMLNMADMFTQHLSATNTKLSKMCWALDDYVPEMQEFCGPEFVGWSTGEIP